MVSLPTLRSLLTTPQRMKSYILINGLLLIISTLINDSSNLPTSGSKMKHRVKSS